MLKTIVLLFQSLLLLFYNLSIGPIFTAKFSAFSLSCPLRIKNCWVTLNSIFHDREIACEIYLKKLIGHEKSHGREGVCICNTHFKFVHLTEL